MSMNELTVFNYADKQVRAFEKDGKPWFCASDVCMVLELGNTSQAVTRLEKDEKGLISNDTPGGKQYIITVSESGLYSLILGSRKPEAKYFKHWVTHEVIPSIRKHGMYATPATVEAMLADPDTMIATLQALKQERERSKQLEQRIESDKPYTAFGKAIEAVEEGMLIRDFSKLLASSGVPVGEKRLYEWLRVNGYLMSNGENKNKPYQRYVDQGLFIVKEHAIVSGDATFINTTTRVTGKGQAYFTEKVKAALAAS